MKLDNENENLKVNKVKVLTVSLIASFTIFFTVILIGALVIKVKHQLKLQKKK